MSFFHRPGDSSSEESSSEEEDEIEASLNDASQSSARDSTRTAEEVLTLDNATESLSLTNTISNGENGVTDIDEARNVMIASMLEELSKYKAAELLNRANAGNGILLDKNSPEVATFAKSLFARSSGVLNSGGLMSAESASEQKKSQRAQYLTALEQASYQGWNTDAERRASADRGRLSTTGAMSTALVRRSSQQPVPFQATTSGQFQQLVWEMDNMNVVRRPSVDMQLTPLPPSFRVRSHYQTTFEERGMLGRGGFGKVFHTYNIYDQKEYAIKKIPLSPKLSERYHESGLNEVKHVLREVQALAQLDHCNVVRYHATWIEEPTAPVPSSIGKPFRPMPAQRNRLLLDQKPAEETTASFPKPFHRKASIVDSSSPRQHDGPTIGRIISATSDEDASNEKINDSFDPFARSSGQIEPAKPLWSHQRALSPSSRVDRETDIFTDGHPHRNGSIVSALIDDPTVYVLHVQMSMYPMTLSDYLLPSSSPRRTSSPPAHRHCFHLGPALKLMLSILCGLQYIHSRGYIHRDIKPSNIFLSTLEFSHPLAFASEQGYVDVGSCRSCTHQQPRFINPRIGDFGLVSELERTAATDIGRHSRSDSAGSSHKVVGTEYYRPPSHKLTPDLPDEKLDVFALGVILVELLWSCGTQMERMRLLQGCQSGDMPDGLREMLKEQEHSDEVADMVEACVFCMIDPNPKTRWRCAMIKSGIEGVLERISRDQASDIPD